MHLFFKRRILSKSLLTFILFFKKNIIFSSKKQTSKTGLIFDKIFFDPIFRDNHPENPNRLKLATKNIKTNVLLKKNLKNFLSRTASLNEISLIHTQNHIDGIKKNYGSKVDLITRTGVGAVLNACDHIINGDVTSAFVASRLPGHHAINYGRKEGFCFYNNIAIAAKYL